MTSIANGRPTNKDRALAAIDRARGEAIRPDCSLSVIAALLGDAWLAVDQIEELRKARPKAKAAKEPVAP